MLNPRCPPLFALPAIFIRLIQFLDPLLLPFTLTLLDTDLNIMIHCRQHEVEHLQFPAFTGHLDGHVRHLRYDLVRRRVSQMARKRARYVVREGELCGHPAVDFGRGVALRGKEVWRRALYGFGVRGCEVSQTVHCIT